MMLTIPAPAPIHGDLLATEVGAALAVDAAEVRVVLAGDEVEVTVPDGADTATVERAVAAHDPEAFAAVDWTMPADGTTAATVRWQKRSTAGTQVSYDVNGTAGSATADTEGVVELAITAATPGPVRVTVGSLTVTLTAEEV